MNEDVIRLKHGIPQIPREAADACSVDKRIRKVTLAPGSTRHEVFSRLQVPCKLVWRRDAKTDEMEFAGPENYKPRTRRQRTCVAYGSEEGSNGSWITGWQLEITPNDLQVFRQYCLPQVYATTVETEHRESLEPAGEPVASAPSDGTETTEGTGNVGPGFGPMSLLNAADGPSRLIEAHNHAVRGQLLTQARSASSADFEQLIKTLLERIGFADVEVTPSVNDRGVDVRGTLVVGDVVCVRMAVQAKRWKDNVRSPIVQQVRGSLGAHEQGLIITTSDFSAGARREAERSDASPVALMDGEKLADLMVNYEVGVQREEYRLLTLCDTDEATP